MMKQLELDFSVSEEARKYYQTCNLLYRKTSSGVLFLGKRITDSDYVLINGETGERFFITRAKLRKDYLPLKKANKRNKNKVRIELVKGRRNDF